MGKLSNWRRINHFSFTKSLTLIAPRIIIRITKNNLYLLKHLGVPELAVSLTIQDVLLITACLVLTENGNWQRNVDWHLITFIRMSSLFYTYAPRDKRRKRLFLESFSWTNKRHRYKFVKFKATSLCMLCLQFVTEFHRRINIG